MFVEFLLRAARRARSRSARAGGRRPRGARSAAGLSESLEKLRELFEQRLKEQKERHDGGNRWIGTGGTSPFGTGGQNPNGDARRRRRRAQRDGRSPTSAGSSEYRRDVVLDVRQIDVALRGLRRLGREGAEEELDLDETDRQDLQERRRDRGRVPAAAPQPRQGRAADGRRRLDGSARRADVPAVHRGVAHRPVREVPQLLLPQLRLQLGLRGRAVPQAGPGRRSDRAQRSRREARARRRRADAPRCSLMFPLTVEGIGESANELTEGAKRRADVQRARKTGRLAQSP